MPLYPNLSIFDNQLRFTLTLHDKDARGGVPIKGLFVMIRQLNSDGKPEDLLVNGTTDLNGQISFFLVDQPLKDAPQPVPPLPKIQCSFLDIDGAQIGDALILQPDRKKELLIEKISVKSHREKIMAPLDRLKTELGVSFSSKLEQVLTTQKITSLLALRATPHIVASSGLTQLDIKEIERLQKHAQLQLISRDHKQNQLLIDAGISDVTDIARLPAISFADKLKGKIDQKTSSALHSAALQATAAASRLALRERVHSANEVMTAQTRAVETQPCNCDCQSAVSPLAYLADLLNYTVRHVQFKGTEISLDSLGELFHQPFATLPADSSTSETQLRQIRLCIEVLRNKAAKEGTNIEAIVLAHAKKSYLTLLTALGVPYTDFRLARAASGERKQVLADRLGVPVDHLFKFLLSDNDQTEERLEEIFGLPATTSAGSLAAESMLQKTKIAKLTELWRDADKSTQPVWLEPDFVSDEFFAVVDSTAEKLLQERRKAIDKCFKSVSAGFNSADSLTDVITAASTKTGNGVHGLAIGTKAELDDFNKQRQAGRAYTRMVSGQPAALDFSQLSIRKVELDQLLIVRQLAAENSAVPADWDEAHHILVAIEKRSQLFPEWQAEERANNVVLSPAVFKVPGDALAVLTRLQKRPPAFLKWRLDQGALRNWMEVLTDRISQRDSAIAGIQAATDAVEEAHLVAFRDALINAVVRKSEELKAAKVKSTDALAEQLEKKRKWVTNHLLISAHESACRKTTRTAQAIECLQLLNWGLHSKLFERHDFILEAPDFEHEWKSLGSYKAWRALMWVYLYPENIARPSFSQRVQDDPTQMNLEIYKFLMEYWPLLAKDPAAARPDRSVRSLLWRVTQRKALDLVEMRFNDQDFMTTAWLEALWESFRSSDDNSNQVSNNKLISEYFIPIDIAFRLQDEGRSAEALEWLQRAINLPTGSPKKPALAEYLNSLSSISADTTLNAGSLNVTSLHITTIRTRGGYERRVLLGAISAYLDMAEADFASDTAESLARSREAYLTALELLNSPIFGEFSAPCDALTIEIGDEKIKQTVVGIRDDVLKQNPFVEYDREQLIEADISVEKLIKKLGPSSDMSAFRKEVSLVYSKVKPISPAKTMKNSVDESAKMQAQQARNKLEAPEVFLALQSGFVLSGGQLLLIDRIPAPAFSFCIPRNPVLLLLRLRAESGFYKLTHCMNFSGLKRETPVYSAPIDVTSGVSLDLVESASRINNEYFMPPGAIIYRFRTLIERAKQLVAIAQQMESTYLQFLEKRDAEQYLAQKARQDLGLANATVSLQDLRILEAAHGIELSDLQGERVNENLEHYRDLLEDGISFLEGGALISSYVAAAVEGTAALAAVVAGVVAGASITGVISALATAGVGTPAGAAAGGAAGGGAALIASGILGGGKALSSLASAMSMHASFERRTQEWEFQKTLAEIDKQIAEFQTTLAQDRYQITFQERRISELSRDHASDVVEFLSNKFTSRELYAWMAGVVGQTYSYFLQQAASIAKLAQRQLAFERQEAELGYILEDYWTYRSSTSSFTSGEERDRKGMTGSARLLHDITRLDQHAFLTDRRRIAVPKHFSLSTHDPVAFIRFRESGVLHIATSLAMFDRDFPGDYLRLVKRIRVAVIALVPPLDGIKATLSSTGISRVVRGGDRYIETSMTTQPETIAITAPVPSSGVMELQQEQADMLLPFEGLGVAGNWVLNMPKAANAFDFNTIADVVFTIEYTAIFSDEYRAQLVQRLNADRSFEGERAFSLRQHFADEWYNLHHPELFNDATKKLRPTLALTRADFPPNLTEGSLKLNHLSIYIVRKDGVLDEVTLSDLSWEWAGVNGSSSVNSSIFTTRNGLLSTRDVPATAWLGQIQGQPAVGRLTFKLGDTFSSKPIEQALREGMITDILIAVAVKAERPLWPV